MEGYFVSIVLEPPLGAQHVNLMRLQKPTRCVGNAGVFESGDVLVVELPQRMNGGRTPSWPDLQALQLVRT